MSESEASSSSAEETRLEELLDQWEDAQERGEDLSPESLCRDCPELVVPLKAKISALREMEARLHTDNMTAVLTLPTYASEEQIQEHLQRIQHSGGGEGQINLVILPTFGELKLHQRGGLGAVYCGRDLQLHREVALKFIHANFAKDSASRQRFLLEAEITGRLDHPGVVPVHGLGQSESGQLFYVMRFIRGETLDDAVKRFHNTLTFPQDSSHDSGPNSSRNPSVNASTAKDSHKAHIAFRDLLSRFVSVCKTIAYAHTRGVVHCDIKPQNVMLGKYGETLVVDWGLARAISRAEIFKVSGEKTLIPGSGSSSSSSGGGGGTLAFMSPEQASGEAGLTPASDIYSLGATLYQILTGRPPIKADSIPSYKLKIIRGDFQPPAAVNSKCPRQLDAICRKAMKLDGAQRYSTAIDLATEVERYLADESVEAFEESRWFKMSRWMRHNGAVAMVGGVAMLALLLVSTGSAFWLWELANAEHAAAVAADQSRQETLRVWAKAVADLVEVEIDRRWRILLDEADDPLLHSVLQKLNTREKDSLDQSAQQWLDQRAADLKPHIGDSLMWLNDIQGRQVARFPARNDVFGRRYDYRTYFHGGAFDLNVTEDGDPAHSPLQDPVHLSAVFRSVAKGTYMVALSVPVWGASPGNDSNGQESRRVIGVLSMAIDLGEWDPLKLQDQNKIVILADLRKNRLRAGAKETDLKDVEGVVLHHPHLAEQLPTDKANPFWNPPQLGDDLVAKLQTLRDNRAGGGQSLGMIIPGDYRDPLEQDGQSARWLAACEPVFINNWQTKTSSTERKIGDTGWIVIVQERIGK